eukprot:comp22477_c0_seq1/m.55593 comp22477_c0_seq1/g.55593  ORF comp22477_c0_seq1/g.55593 comp22477_c0_seq1/m.55593 type:complete len:620 (-) comp22477_c0_seq1:180-2039(-)
MGTLKMLLLKLLLLLLSGRNWDIAQLHVCRADLVVAILDRHKRGVLACKIVLCRKLDHTRARIDRRNNSRIDLRLGLAKDAREEAALLPRSRLLRWLHCWCARSAFLELADQLARSYGVDHRALCRLGEIDCDCRLDRTVECGAAQRDRVWDHLSAREQRIRHKAVACKDGRRNMRGMLKAHKRLAVLGPRDLDVAQHRLDRTPQLAHHLGLDALVVGDELGHAAACASDAVDQCTRGAVADAEREDTHGACGIAHRSKHSVVVVDLAVSQHKDLAQILAVQLLPKDHLESREDLCATHVCAHRGDMVDGLAHCVLVVVLCAAAEELGGRRAKRHNVELGPGRHRAQEELQGVLCLLDLCAAHGARAVDHKDDLGGDLCCLEEREQRHHGGGAVAAVVVELECSLWLIGRRGLEQGDKVLVHERGRGGECDACGARIGAHGDSQGVGRRCDRDKRARHDCIDGNCDRIVCAGAANGGHLRHRVCWGHCVCAWGVSWHHCEREDKAQIVAFCAQTSDVCESDGHGLARRQVAHRHAEDVGLVLFGEVRAVSACDCGIIVAEGLFFFLDDALDFDAVDDCRECRDGRVVVERELEDALNRGELSVCVCLLNDDLRDGVDDD